MRNHEYGGSIVKLYSNSWLLGIQFPHLPLCARVNCIVFDTDFISDWEQLPLGDVITHFHLSANGEPKATFATGVEYKENKKERHFSEVLGYRMCYRLEIIVKFPTHFCHDPVIILGSIWKAAECANSKYLCLEDPYFPLNWPLYYLSFHAMVQPTAYWYTINGRFS